MIFRTILCVAVFAAAVTCARASDEGDQDDRLNGLCNREIPEDRSVDVGGECRTSQNCQQADTECVAIRENYCVCQVADERGLNKKPKSKKKMKEQCKKNKGFTCTKKSTCRKKYRKREKKCKHWGMTCCSKCKTQIGYECVSKKMCPKGSGKKLYQCDQKSEVCCKKTVSVCSDLSGHTCMAKDKCPGSLQVMTHVCGSPAEVCCPPFTYDYVPKETTKNFDDAKGDCESKGGNLAMFKNSDDVAAVLALKQQHSLSANDEFWVGIIVTAPGQWEFIDGTPMESGASSYDYLSEESMIYWVFSAPFVDGLCMHARFWDDSPYFDIKSDECDLLKKYICQIYKKVG